MKSKAGEMLISWYSGMQCCSLKYLILVKSEIGSRKWIFLLRIVWVCPVGFLCVFFFNTICLFSMLQIIIDCS